ncbi:MAG: hypothetical protein OXC81_06285 [Betaproteobacteria bacterium]|nr:hypothetical protein [Betaproteobacteria bacterium]
MTSLPIGIASRWPLAGSTQLPAKISRCAPRYFSCLSSLVFS